MTSTVDNRIPAAFNITVLALDLTLTQPTPWL